MKKNMFAIVLTLSFGVISCSNSVQFDADGEKVMKVFLGFRGIAPENIEIEEIKLIRNITVEDSINYKLSSQQMIDGLIADYKRCVDNLNFSINTYDGTSGMYLGPKDSLIKQNKAEVNKFSDAFEGKVDDDKWLYNTFYKEIYHLRKQDLNKIVGKIYSISFKTKSSDAIATETYVFDANLQETIGGTRSKEEIEAPRKYDLEKVHFPYYK